MTQLNDSCNESNCSKLCNGIFCYKWIDNAIVKTTVESLFGGHFTVYGNYNPTKFELLFGIRKKKLEKLNEKLSANN